MKEMSFLNRIKCALSSTFAIAFLLVLPLGYLVLTGLPQKLEMQVKMERPGSVRIGTRIADSQDGTAKVRFERIKGCRGGGVWRQVQVFLPTDFNATQMVLGFDGAPSSVAVRNVSLTRRLVLCQLFDVSLKDGVWACTQIGGTRFSVPRKFGSGLVMIVAGLFALSLGGTWLFTKPVARRDAVVLSVVVALLACLFVGFAVPLQSYLANKSAFPMSLGEFMGESLLFVVVATTFLCATLYFSSWSWGCFLHALVLAFLVYEYLQTGILSIGEPALNGDVTYYNDFALRKRDALVLCVSLGTLSIGYHWLRRYLHWISAGLGVMIAASLVDIKVEKVKADEGIDGLALAPGLCSKFDAAQNVCYSTNRNVMMIVLDSVTTEVFAETLKRNPELSGSFDGFTEFHNNFCPHTYTQYGVAVYMTGKCYEEEHETPATVQEFALSCFGSDSLLVPYVQSGNAISFVPGSTLNGYSWPISSQGTGGSEAQVEDGIAFLRRKNEIPPLSLFDVSRVRLTPFFLKAPLLIGTFAATRLHASVRHERELYPMLANAPIRDDVKLSLTVFHTEGAHPPFDVGKDGVPLSMPRMDFDGYCDKAYWVLKQFGDLLESFRRRGIYDNSMIILTTDHGSGVCRDRLAAGLSGCARAMLCVKPEYAKGPLTVSDVPTSHTKLRALVVAARDRALTKSEISGILHQETRQYIEPSPDGAKKWLIDGNGVASRQQ